MPFTGGDAGGSPSAASGSEADRSEYAAGCGDRKAISFVAESKHCTFPGKENLCKWKRTGK